MFDIKGKTTNDVLMYLLTKEAKEAERKIKQTYLFHIGETFIETWRDGEYYEYLTSDGVWKVHIPQIYFEMKCDAETIFELMKKAYITTTEYENDENYLMEKRINARIFHYFEKFLRRTEKKYALLKVFDFLKAYEQENANNDK